MSQKAILGYWGPRGLCERVKIAFEHVGFEYENRVFVNDGTHDWLPVKPNLGMEFPNLPYLIDGDFKLSQSMAILKYVARKKGNISPDSVDKWAQAEMMEGIINDICGGFAGICYNSNYEDLKGPYLEDLKLKLARFDHHFGKNKWLIGDQLTYVDFCLGEILDHLRLWVSGLYQNHINLKRYLHDYDNLESVSNHRKASSYNALPCNGPGAMWGGKQI